MSGSDRGSERNGVRMDLKYCEHCGGLWVREGGAGVYCEKCQPKVADLPAPRPKRGGVSGSAKGRVILPVQRETVLGDYDFNVPDDILDLE